MSSVSSPRRGVDIAATSLAITHVLATSAIESPHVHQHGPSHTALNISGRESFKILPRLCLGQASNILAVY